jgi:hypothetical protein
VRIQKGARLWRLMSHILTHEAPDARTRRLYAGMRSAPPLRGKAANRAATAPWLEDVHEELSRVLGASGRYRPVSTWHAGRRKEQHHVLHLTAQAAARERIDKQLR